MLFLLVQLKANILTIEPFNFFSFSLKSQQKEECLEATFSTGNLNFSLDFMSQYYSSPLSSINSFEAIVVIFKTQEQYQYWLPYFLSSVFLYLPLSTIWKLFFDLSFEITDTGIVKNIVYNTSFLNFAKIKINDDVIDAQIIQKAKEFVKYACMSYTFLEAKGWLHLEVFQNIKDFKEKKIYNQIYQYMIFKFFSNASLPMTNQRYTLELMNRITFLAKELRIDLNDSLVNLTNILRNTFMRLFTKISDETIFIE